MVEISEKAEEVLRDYFKEKEITPIRIFLQTGGWAGPSLAMVLDEPTDDDEVFEVKDFTMIMSKDLVEQAKDVTVDYVVYGMGSGFKLTSEVPVGGGGCGSTSCNC